MTLLVKFETECWRPLVEDAAYRAGIAVDDLSTSELDALADLLCRNVLDALADEGIAYQRAHGQRVGAFVILQNPDHPAADRFAEICYEQADRLDFTRFDADDFSTAEIDNKGEIMMEKITKFAKAAHEWRAVSISVWLDDTSAERGWIVDYVDADGNSLTVRVFASEAEARQFAESLSGAVGLPVR